MIGEGAVTHQSLIPKEWALKYLKQAPLMTAIKPIAFSESKQSDSVVCILLGQICSSLSLLTLAFVYACKLGWLKTQYVMGKVSCIHHLRNSAEAGQDRTDPSGPHCMRVDFCLGFEEASVVFCFRLYSMYITVTKLLDQVMWKQLAHPFLHFRTFWFM